jgi:hypothetical protein
MRSRKVATARHYRRGPACAYPAIRDGWPAGARKQSGNGREPRSGFSFGLLFARLIRLDPKHMPIQCDHVRSYETHFFEEAIELELHHIELVLGMFTVIDATFSAIFNPRLLVVIADQPLLGAPPCRNGARGYRNMTIPELVKFTSVDFWTV